MLSLTDTHIHLDAPELNGQGLALLPAARQQGVGCFIVPGVRVSGWQNLVDLTTAENSVYAAPGLHPAYADQWSQSAAETLRQYVQQPKVVAIGEIGLDGASGPPIVEQEQVLRSQLQIALEAGLPVLLHGRQATGKLLAILREMEIGQNVGGIWHGFSGSLQVAEELVKLGFKIGVGPILLRQTARKLPLAVQALPASALLLETDLPDMADLPELLLEIAMRVAELRACSLAEVAEITSENVTRLFAIKPQGRED